MNAVTSKVSLQHSTGWAKNNPVYAMKSLQIFHNSYSEDYEISIDKSRDGFITYIAELKESD